MTTQRRPTENIYLPLRVLLISSVSLQHTATHCNTLQHTATYCNSLPLSTVAKAPKNWGAIKDTLQHTATHCNTPQHTATLCNTLQHAVTHSLYLQWQRSAWIQFGRNHRLLYIQCRRQGLLSAGVLQCVEVCCSVSQCVAVCRGVFRTMQALRIAICW